MGNSILAGLMVSSCDKSNISGFQRSAGHKEGEDSFSDIFKDKLRGFMNSQKKTYMATQDSSHRKPENQMKKPVSMDEASPVKTGFNNDGPDAATVRDKVAKRENKLDPISDSEDEKRDEAEKFVISDEIASLLESLFDELSILISGLSDIEADKMGNMAPEDTGGPLEALRAMLDGSLNRLHELLDQMRSIQVNTNLDFETNALLEQIEAMLSEIEQNDSSAWLKTTLTKDGESVEDLITQLQGQCRHLADKLRAHVASEANQAQIGESNDSLKPTTGMVQEEVDAVEEGDDNQNVSDQKASKSEKAKADGWERSEVIETESTAAWDDSDSTPQTRQDIPAQSAEPIQASRNVKAESTPFYLSEKLMNQTVTNQVAMKIKLMAGENKQELEMHLKPESLGKLTLKIIHQRGEVLARITAENDQVRSILENNMQLLKDSLEKSGYSVQSLDVSVGNESSGNQQAHPQGQDRAARGQEKDSEPVIHGIRRTVRNTLYGSDLPGDSQLIDLTA